MLKIPPHSIEAEQSVLGSLLIDKDGFLVISDMLLKDDFYDDKNSKIYEIMQELYSKNKPIDIITVKDRLQDRGFLEEIGGLNYIIELTEIVPTSSNIFEYAQIVKNKAVNRKLIKAGNEIILNGYNEEKNITELLEFSEKSLFGVTQVFIKNKLVHISDILDSRFQEFAEVHENPESVKNHRLYTGFKNLDNTLGGLKGGDMVILAARPSMGKTAFSLSLAQNIGFNGKNVAIFSLEMSKEQLTDRLISSSIGINSWKLAKGELADDEFAKLGEAMEKLSQANIFIDDSAGGSLTDLKSKSRRLKMESGLDLIVIDYLQLMSNGNSMNRVQEISEISRGIKSLARELDVPIIALSQLSRAVETRMDKKPILSDLRESGSIEQDADIVMMLYREEYYDEFTDKKGVTDIAIRKNRNGPVGTVELMFNKSNQQFYEIETGLKEDDF
ncbi:MAG: replicative DNA helicase [Candidatus Gracilibacteria bacterium]|nr:replicative DNA helicase [Candidatus Gracilibacteria bacterium]